MSRVKVAVPLVPMHITEVQKKLDVARIYEQTVDIWAWEKSTGDIIHYQGWLVIGSHWRGGTHNLRNPLNGEIRQVRDINIFKFSGHEVYV